MGKKPKKPAAGPGSARHKAAAAAQSRNRSRADFALAALREVTSQSSNAFTMKDEARNTGHRSSLWGGETKLRAKPIGFVSAGLVEPLERDESQCVPEHQSSKELAEDVMPTDDKPSFQQATNRNPAAEKGTPTLEVSAPPRDLSEASTSRARAAVTASEMPAEMPAEMLAGNPAPVEVRQPEAMGFMFDVTGDKSLAALHISSSPRIPDPQSAAEESDSSSEVILFKGRGNPGRAKGSVEQKRAEQTVTLDTIHYEIKSAKSSKTTAKLHASPSRSQIIPCSPRAEPPPPEPRDKLDRLLDSDDEEAAIIADYIANMAEDSEEDTDVRLPGQRFVRADLGADYGHLENGNSESSGSSDDSAASEDDDERHIVMDGDMVDLQESDDNRLASPTMDDETLARLLGKQEELGMGSDELILVSAFGDTGRKSRRGKGGHARSQGPFPSASAVADAFDDLDLMDWERPSLQNQRKRGRKGQPPAFGLSDSEMEQTLQTAWQKDRESKKSRKVHREELRSQGLLGKHADPDDPRLRYPTGMTLDDVKSEFRSFLAGSEPRLELPPMDKSARKTLHLIARQFKVKSQSTGSGNQRRPTLIRTKYTARYTEEHLEIAMSNVGPQHFPRLDLKGKGKATPKKSRGGGNSAVTYQEGEVVGASAPELGQENKGRTMLEKMGWSSGMGLGSLDNKGILQPVAHEFKRTKAGLG